MKGEDGGSWEESFFFFFFFSQPPKHKMVFELLNFCFLGEQGLEISTNESEKEKNGSQNE